MFNLTCLRDAQWISVMCLSGSLVSFDCQTMHAGKSLKHTDHVSLKTVFNKFSELIISSQEGAMFLKMRKD